MSGTRLAEDFVVVFSERMRVGGEPYITAASAGNRLSVGDHIRRPQTRGPTEHTVISHSAGGQKSMEEASVDSDSGEDSFPSLQMASLLPCPHMASRD